MNPLKSFLILRAGMVALACTAANGQQLPPADRDDAALAYAQCMRDNGYAEFPDPGPNGIQFLIDPESAPRFKKAADACRDLAPAGLGTQSVTPDQLDALIKLSQCVRENGVADFPDPNGDGGFDLGSISVPPGDARFEKAMAACRDLAGDAPIMIGG